MAFDSGRSVKRRFHSDISRVVVSKEAKKNNKKNKTSDKVH